MKNTYIKYIILMSLISMQIDAYIVSLYKILSPDKQKTIYFFGDIHTQCLELGIEKRQLKAIEHLIKKYPDADICLDGFVPLKIQYPQVPEETLNKMISLFSPLNIFDEVFQSLCDFKDNFKIFRHYGRNISPIAYLIYKYKFKIMEDDNLSIDYRFAPDAIKKDFLSKATMRLKRFNNANINEALSRSAEVDYSDELYMYKFDLLDIGMIDTIIDSKKPVVFVFAGLKHSCILTALKELNYTIEISNEISLNKKMIERFFEEVLYSSKITDKKMIGFKDVFKALEEIFYNSDYCKNILKLSNEIEAEKYIKSLAPKKAAAVFCKILSHLVEHKDIFKIYHPMYIKYFFCLVSSFSYLNEKQILEICSDL